MVYPTVIIKFSRKHPKQTRKSTKPKNQPTNPKNPKKTPTQKHFTQKFTLYIKREGHPRVTVPTN
jgi:hypothetical protein